MPLIKCPACGNDVSDAAAACPKCGHPMQSPPQLPSTKSSSGCLVVLILVVVIFMIRGCDEEGTPPPATPQETAQQKDDFIMGRACLEAERQVKARLKAPSSAEFPGCFLGLGEYRFHIDRPKREVVVYGWVDAQNSFGAKLRKNFAVTLHSSSDLDGDPRWSRAEVTLAGE